MTDIEHVTLSRGVALNHFLLASNWRHHRREYQEWNLRGPADPFQSCNDIRGQNVLTPFQSRAKSFLFGISFLLFPSLVQGRFSPLLFICNKASMGISRIKYERPGKPFKSEPMSVFVFFSEKSFQNSKMKTSFFTFPSAVEVTRPAFCLLAMATGQLGLSWQSDLKLRIEWRNCRIWKGREFQTNPDWFLLDIDWDCDFVYSKLDWKKNSSKCNKLFPIWLGLEKREKIQDVAR